MLTTTAVWALLASYLIFFLLFSCDHTVLPSILLPCPAPCSQNPYVPVLCVWDTSQQFLHGFIRDCFQFWHKGNLHIDLLCLLLQLILYLLIMFYFHYSTSLYWSYHVYGLFHVSAPSTPDYDLSSNEVDCYKNGCDTEQDWDGPCSYKYHEEFKVIITKFYFSFFHLILQIFPFTKCLHDLPLHCLRIVCSIETILISLVGGVLDYELFDGIL